VKKIARVLFGFGFFLVSSPSFSQVPTSRCTALNFYGNAAASGLCQSLSPATQNLAVCELSAGQPDIHLTFQNATPPPPAIAVPLHLTVRSLPCQGNVTIQRNAANAFVAVAPPPLLCAVNPANYVARMNAQGIAPAGGGQSACRAGFLAAIANGKLTPQSAQGYLDSCNTAGPANTACP